MWCVIWRETVLHNYLCGFVDFVLIPTLVHKHRSRLSILKHRRVHSEPRGQSKERFLQDAAPHRAALRSHGRACSWSCSAICGETGEEQGRGIMRCQVTRCYICICKQSFITSEYLIYLTRRATAWRQVSCSWCWVPGWLTSALR